jgi:hypothetical protein
MKGLMAGALAKGLKSGALSKMGALSKGLKSGVLSKLGGDSDEKESTPPVVSAVVKAANTVVNGKAQAAQVSDLLHNPNVRKAAQNLVDELKSSPIVVSPPSPVWASPPVAPLPVASLPVAPLPVAPLPVASLPVLASPHVGGRRKTRSKGKGKGKSKKSRKSKSTKRR